MSSSVSSATWPRGPGPASSPSWSMMDVRRLLGGTGVLNIWSCLFARRQQRGVVSGAGTLLQSPVDRCRPELQRLPTSDGWTDAPRRNPPRDAAYTYARVDQCTTYVHTLNLLQVCTDGSIPTMATDIDVQRRTTVHFNASVVSVCHADRSTQRRRRTTMMRIEMRRRRRRRRMTSQTKRTQMTTTTKYQNPTLNQMR